MNMLSRLPVLAAVVSLLALPAAARAGVSHLVTPGETLSGIAAANGLSPAQLAAANGLPADAFVIAGRSLTVPAPGTTTTASATDGQAATPAPFGGYRVRLGDSLSAIAAEHGVSLSQLAAINGLSSSGTLVAGTSLRLPSAAASSPARPSPASPRPTASHLRRSQQPTACPLMPSSSPAPA
jgi:LysM repeat protein